MDISTVETLVTRPGRNYVLVRIETADGLVGWGDATLNGREQAVAATLSEHIAPELEGRDAARVEDIWQYLFRGTYWRGGPVLNSALSGVDMALWDLKGKRAGEPVYELLGGRTRDYAAAYKHCGGETVDEIVEQAQDALDRGIDYLRVNIGNPEGEYLALDRTIEGVNAVRDRLPDAELIVDIHGRASPRQARRIATGLEPADLYFLEDPLRPENKDSFERLRQATTIPLAMGELFTNPWEMRPLIERELVDFLRVDLSHVGGITAARKLAAIAEHHYVETAFHGPPDLSPVGQAASVHVDLAVPNFGIQELTDYDAYYDDLVEDVFSGGATLEEGVGGFDVADAPGLGIEVDVATAREYEYEREHLPTVRHEDGSVADW